MRQVLLESQESKPTGTLRASYVSAYVITGGVQAKANFEMTPVVETTKAEYNSALAKVSRKITDAKATKRLDVKESKAVLDKFRDARS